MSSLCNPMDGCPLDFSIHGISQTRILEQVAISYSRGSSQARDWTHVLHLLHWQGQADSLSLVPPGKPMQYVVVVQLLSYANSLQPPGLQLARFPCPSPSPRVHSNSCPLSRWCHPTISSSVIPFSSCPQSFPASGSFPVSQLFTSVAKVLEFQHQYFQWIFKVDFL